MTTHRTIRRPGSHWVAWSMTVVLGMGLVLVAEDNPEARSRWAARRRPARDVRPAQEQNGEARQRRGGTDLRTAEEMINRLREENPEQFEQLMQLRETDPQAFRQELTRVIAAHHFRGRPGTTRMAPEEATCRDLSRQYLEAADPDARERIRAELEQAVNVAFEARISRYRQHLERLETQMELLRSRIESMEDNREKICAIRVDELTRPPELNWD